MMAPSKEQMLKELVEQAKSCFGQDVHQDRALGVYHCYSLLALKRVYFSVPTLTLIMSGEKEFYGETISGRAHAGTLFLLPHDLEITVSTGPKDGQPHHGASVRFGPEELSHFKQVYGHKLSSWDLKPHWTAPATIEVLQAFSDWLKLYSRKPLDPELLLHRKVELLLVLAKAGLAGNFLVGQDESWRLKLTRLFLIDPARDWKISEVCKRFLQSESSLRRRLKDEGHSFRDLLAEVRLDAGMALLQHSEASVLEVADAVGYRSASRFSERFRARYGLAPSEMKARIDTAAVTRRPQL